MFYELANLICYILMLENDVLELCYIGKMTRKCLYVNLFVLQDCYPERLGKMLIIHAPRIFMAVWKIIYPFIDEKTKTKVIHKKTLYGRILM